MVAGVSSRTGLVALLPVEEASRRGPGHALSQNLLTAEQTALGKAVRLKIATSRIAQVKILAMDLSNLSPTSILVIFLKDIKLHGI